MLILSVITTALVFIATLLPVSKKTHWVVRSMDFPRLQIAFIAVALIIIDFIFLDLTMNGIWLLISVAAFCLSWQLWWVLPYTFLWPKEVKTSKINDEQKKLSILTSNVLQTNYNSDALIGVVKENCPDILVTLESDIWWEDKLKVLEIDMPYSVKCPLDNLYGMHVYSKLPFTEETISYLVESGIPSIHLSLELRSGNKVRMHFVHPAPPSPTENTESKERDAELITIARSIEETSHPVIVTGDFNDVAWSKTTRLFRKISGLLDPRVGRGMFNTFHVDYFFLRWPLDHLFHSAHFTVKKIQRLPSIGSDHFALFTVLTFEEIEKNLQKGLTATKGEHIEAEIISDEKGVKQSSVPKPYS